MKLTCVGCRSLTSVAMTKTLDSRLLKNRKNLVPPRVSSELAQIWLRVAKSRAGVDAICAACAKRIREEIGTIKVKDGGAINGVSAFAPLTDLPAPKAAHVEPVEKLELTSAIHVAKAINRGERIRFGSRKQGMTQCIVAANAPEACDRWGDWQTMRTLRSSETSRAFFPFCDTCREIVEKCIHVKFGVSLREAITGEKPNAQPDNVIKFPREPETKVVPIGCARSHHQASKSSVIGTTAVRIKVEGTGSLRCSEGGEYVRMLFDPNNYEPLAADSDRIKGGVCGACKDRLKNARTRVKRAQMKTRAAQGLGVKRRKK